MYQEEPYASGDGSGLFLIMLLVVLGSAVAVYIDAKRIGARRGLVTGIANNEPAVWAFGVVALWILVLPIYLVSRSKIRAAAEDQRTGASRPQYQPYHQTAWGYAAPTAPYAQAGGSTVGPVSPPAGWYGDPDHQGYNRWWDGHRWTEHRTPKPY